MATDFDRIQEDALGALAAAADSAALEKWRIAFLGRSAPVMAALGTLGALPKEERKAFGQRGNQVKQALERAFEEAGERIRQAELASALPGRRHRRDGAGAAARSRAACIRPRRRCAGSTRSSRRWASRSTGRATSRPTR